MAGLCGIVSAQRRLAESLWCWCCHQAPEVPSEGVDRGRKATCLAQHGVTVSGIEVGQPPPMLPPHRLELAVEREGAEAAVCWCVSSVISRAVAVAVHGHHPVGRHQGPGPGGQGEERRHHSMRVEGRMLEASGGKTFAEELRRQRHGIAREGCKAVAGLTAAAAGGVVRPAGGVGLEQHDRLEARLQAARRR